MWRISVTGYEQLNVVFFFNETIVFSAMLTSHEYHFI